MIVTQDRAVGEGGHCMLKWGFTRTFHGNQDAALKNMSELIFIKFC